MVFISKHSKTPERFCRRQVKIPGFKEQGKRKGTRRVLPDEQELRSFPTEGTRTLRGFTSPQNRLRRDKKMSKSMRIITDNLFRGAKQSSHTKHHYTDLSSDIADSSYGN